MINYSFYPILSGARRQIKELDNEIILHARDHIEKYTPTKNISIDIPVWLASTIILHNLGNKFLIRKFVSNYGKLTFESHFLKEGIKDMDTRVKVLEYLGVPSSPRSSTAVDIANVAVIKLLKNEEYVKIHVNDYLEIAQIIDDNPHFHLINQSLYKGYVYSPIKIFCYLCRLVVERILYNKILKEMKDYHDNELVNQIVEELRGKYPENKHISFKNTSIPQPINDLIQKAYSEHHLNHQERIKLGIYLQGQGYDMDYILDIFKQLSDYSEKTTKYQLESLKRYIK